MQTSISFVLSVGQEIRTGRITCRLLFTLSSWMLSVETFSRILEGSSNGHGYTSAAVLSPPLLQVPAMVGQVVTTLSQQVPTQHVNLKSHPV